MGFGRDFAVLDLRRRAGNLSIPLDLVAAIGRQDFQRLCLDPLAEQHLLGGEVRKVGGDRVVGRTRGQIRTERYAELDLRTDCPAGADRIERRA